MRSSWKAPPIWRLSSTPSFHIIASSIASCAGLMKIDSSPGSLKSVCAANIVTLARRSSSRAASSAAAIASSVPPMQ